MATNLERASLVARSVQIECVTLTQIAMDTHLDPGEPPEELRLGYSLALMSRDQLVDEVRAAGFADLATYGDYRRGSWSPDSPNLIVCARRRAR